MDFTLHQEIPATVDAVDAALVNPDFLVRMAELPKLGSAEVVSNERDGDTVNLQVRYLFQADLSPKVTRFVDPEKLTWIEDSTVDLIGARDHLRDPARQLRQPARRQLLGRRSRPTATGSVRTVTGKIKVRIPLLGGKVEKAIVGGLEENAEAQTDDPHGVPHG